MEKFIEINKISRGEFLIKNLFTFGENNFNVGEVLKLEYIAEKDSEGKLVIKVLKCFNSEKIKEGTKYFHNLDIVFKNSETEREYIIEKFEFLFLIYFVLSVVLGILYFIVIFFGGGIYINLLSFLIIDFFLGTMIYLRNRNKIDWNFSYKLS